MRRISLAFCGAVVGLVGLFGYRAMTPALPSFAITPNSIPRATTTTSTPPPTTVPTTTPTLPVRTGPTTPTTAPPPTTTVAPTTTTPPSTNLRSATGSSVNYIFGILSVDVTVTGSKIDKVSIASINDGGNYRSQSIDQMSIPQLEQQALAAQSANIQGVSGASYTSAGFRQSLQSALGKLGL
jgi:uncharacterized protein with FMN-binding domain